ncbi:unnamed protein product [Bemisia tabaci]|uniref:Conserved oligomeric Golgi complex subunit 6 n=1 Tax=Bemisia tabaci TaxID=7038 RepID=A0A9P0AJ49_BEMTA|nr:unnamed protein product [Bemisia tabaci]
MTGITDSESDASSVSKRLNKILETRVENDTNTLEGLKELSVFFKENTLQSRRNLRSKIEKRSLEINADFLSAFQVVKEKLDSVYNDVKAMNESVQIMTTQLHSTKTHTHRLIEQTLKLQSDAKKISMQQQVAEAFIGQFQLSPEQLALLTDSNISQSFFEALDKVHSIHERCRTLMQSGLRTVALDIMEQMSRYQEAGLDKLYRWAQFHCKGIESIEMSNLLTRAMARLQERPVLFKYVVHEYCISRRAVMVQMFIDALTSGGPGGTPKPIEAHSTDSKRYVGDMLAWLHQAIPNERENILLLLRDCSKEELSKDIDEALSNITEGVCNPLQVRLETVIQQETSPSNLYSVISLLKFYHNIISSVIPGSVLESVFIEQTSACRKQFFSLLEDIVAKMLQDRVEAPPSNLTPAPGVLHLLALLRQVLSVASVTENRQVDIVKIVASVIDPLLQAVSLSAARLTTTDMAVYLLNCFHQMASTLALYEFTDQRLERLQAQSDAQIDTLTSEQASSLVANLNLGPIYTILQDSSDAPLSQIPGMEPECLDSFFGKLEHFLMMPDMLLLPQINYLQSSNHRLEIQRRANEVISAIYRQLYQRIHDPKNMYSNPSHLMPRSPEQVHELLLGLKEPKKNENTSGIISL